MRLATQTANELMRQMERLTRAPDLNPRISATEKMKPNEICCHSLEARLVASKFSAIVLGGTAAPYARRVWGAVIFLIRK